MLNGGNPSNPQQPIHSLRLAPVSCQCFSSFFLCNFMGSFTFDKPKPTMIHMRNPNIFADEKSKKSGWSKHFGEVSSCLIKWIKVLIFWCKKLPIFEMQIYFFFPVKVPNYVSHNQLWIYHGFTMDLPVKWWCPFHCQVTKVFRGPAASRNFSTGAGLESIESGKLGPNIQMSSPEFTLW